MYIHGFFKYILMVSLPISSHSLSSVGRGKHQRVVNRVCCQELIKKSLMEDIPIPLQNVGDFSPSDDRFVY